VARTTESAEGELASPPVHTEGRSSRVTVGCKLPNGIIIHDEHMEEEKGTDGAVIRKFVRHGDPIELAGANASMIIGGYGITRNVDGDFMRKWLKDNADFKPVRQGLIFCNDETDGAIDQARERETVVSGLEPLRADKMPDKLETT
jgi:hypothetical protein